MQDVGTEHPRAQMYSLKGTLNGIIAPSPYPYRIEISAARPDGAIVPQPAAVFTSPSGAAVFSVWSVNQPLVVKDRNVHSHAWCPVKLVNNVP